MKVKVNPKAAARRRKFRLAARSKRGCRSEKAERPGLLSKNSVSCRRRPRCSDAFNDLLAVEWTPSVVEVVPVVQSEHRQGSGTCVSSIGDDDVACGLVLP